MPGKKFSTEINRGVDLLDEQLGPTWLDKVDVAVLDMECACKCILGQLYGMFYKGRSELFGHDSMDTVSTHGFDANWLDYNQLTREWIEEIMKQRKGRQQK